MYRIITHDDLDGFSSGYLVKEMLLNEDINPDLIDVNIMNYEKELDLSKFQKDDEVWITDFSLKPEVMNKLLDITENVTWIDHHKSALEYKPNYNKEVKGFQVDGLAATALVYLWFYAPKQILELSSERLEEWLNNNAPRWVKLVNAWDVWKTNSKYYNGGRLLNLVTSPQLSMELIEKLNDKTFLINLLEEAVIYDSYQKLDNEDFCKKYGFEISVIINSNTEKVYKAFVVNKGNCSSLVFGDRLKEYDLCISFVSNGDSIVVSLYSDKDYMDCSKICKALGGGGHKGAAGFNIDLGFSFKKDGVWVVPGVQNWEE